MRKEDATPVIVLFLSGSVVLCIWQFAQFLGADFGVMMEALLHSLVVLVVAGALWWLMQIHLGLVLSLGTLVLWPIWWPVLASIAAGGHAPDPLGPLPWQMAWYSAPGFLWTVEALLLVVFGCFLIRGTRDSEGFFR